MPIPSSSRSSARTPAAPAGLTDHVSRREAAALLGFASEFKVRQLERRGHLHGVRGAMGQAWYPRAQVLALRALAGPDSGRAAPAVRGGAASPAGLPVGSKGRWSDAALLAHLRAVAAPDGAGAARTVVDLVVDTGITIARAQRVYRFWLAHDRHPLADAARHTARAPGASRATAAAGATATVAAPPGERRGSRRLERDALIRQLRDPDPERRTQAFRRLRHLQADHPRSTGG